MSTGEAETGAAGSLDAGASPGTSSARFYKALAWSVLVVLAAAVAVLRLMQPAQDHGLQGYERWEPTSRRVTQSVSGLGPTATAEERCALFESMFTKRFRDQGMAVKVRQRAPDELNLLCAASIPRTDVAHMAQMVYTDALAALGRPHRIHVYETFIFAPRRRVAIVEPVPPGRKAAVVFDPNRLAEGEWKDRMRIQGPAKTGDAGKDAKPQSRAQSKPLQCEGPPPGYMGPQPSERSRLSRSAVSQAAHPSR